MSDYGLRMCDTIGHESALAVSQGTLYPGCDEQTTASYCDECTLALQRARDYVVHIWLNQARSTLMATLRSRALIDRPVVTSSGLTRSPYFDVRLVSLAADSALLLGSVVLHKFVATGWPGFECVGGMSFGADPVAFATMWAMDHQYELPVDCFSVRRTAKSYGLAKRIEGPSVEGRPALIVDDVATTGASIREAALAIRSAGGKVIGAIALIDRQEGASSLLASEGIAFATCYASEEIIEAKEK